jgi:16S rRNA (guanine527-N7)-methyltransferase
METFGLELSVGELERIDRFIELLIRWNSRVNLVAARSSPQLVDRHVLDSLALTTLTRSVGTAADLGSGAGFPGIPMAITAPRTRVDLFEAREKRATFLREAVRVLRLENVKVWPIRGEHWRSEEKPELVAARGLRTTEAAVVARPLLAVGGMLALMRKQGAERLEGRDYEEMQRMNYRLPGGERHEVLVLRYRPAECFT